MPTGVLWWLIAIAVVAAIAYFYHRRNKGMVTIRLPRDQAENLLEMVKEQREEIGRKRQELVDGAALQGVSVSTEEFIGNIEKLKEKYAGSEREKFSAMIDAFASDLREKYGESIPVDEMHKLQEALEREDQ